MISLGMRKTTTQKFFCLTAIAALYASPSDANTSASDWKLLSREAVRLHREKQYEEAIECYQKAIRQLELQVPPRPDVILDQSLNIVTILLDESHSDEAARVLNAVKEKLKDQGTLLEVRYQRRCRRLLEQTERWEAVPAVQKRIIEVLSAHLGFATQSVTGERCKLVDCYQRAGEWEQALDEAIKINELVRKMPPKMQRRFAIAKSVEQTLPPELGLHCQSWGEKRVLVILSKYSQLVGNDARRVADAVERCAQTMKSNTIYELLLQAISKLRTTCTTEDRRQALEAHFTLMYETSKNAETLEKALQHGLACLTLVKSLKPGKNRDVVEAQAYAMTSIILGKQGKLKQAEEAIDQLRDPGSTLTELEDFGPIFSARDELAKHYRALGKLNECAQQYERLARMLERRRDKLSAVAIARIEALHKQSAESLLKKD
jgi:tetratricopeptide (TPR) repeat protein